MKSEFRALHEGVLYDGWRAASDVSAHLQESLGAQRVRAWFDRLYRTPSLEPNLESMRLVNKFSIGADPEFAFMDGRGQMVYATERFGLNAGACFGADANCRLAELRAAPSRSALKVTASLLKALRLLAYAVPETCQFAWVAYPFITGDGVGGHVHFGRRRISREREVHALDMLARLLREGGVFDANAWAERRSVTPYGRFGDVREQPFGYEYRTCPTYLGSPWMTFLVLTLAKLTAHSCVAFPAYDLKSLRALLAVYKAFDDDALLAWKVMQRDGLPVQTFSDFRTAWGLANTFNAPTRVEFVAPFMAAPAQVEVEELYKHLAQGVPLTLKPPDGLDDLSCKLPDGYSLAVNSCAGAHGYGWAEVLRGLAVHASFIVSTDKDDEGVTIFHSFGPLWEREVRSLADKSGIPLHIEVSRARNRYLTVVASRSLRSGRGANKLREFLMSGLFPLWPARTVTASSGPAWNARWNKKIKAGDSKKYNFDTGGWECAA